jgi:hypothetical protein
LASGQAAAHNRLVAGSTEADVLAALDQPRTTMELSELFPGPAVWNYQTVRTAVAVQPLRRAHALEVVIARLPARARVIAATTVHRAGMRTAPAARATTTSPSSRGWRRASSAGRVNSGSSSKNSTPRCASVQECSPKAPPGCGPLAFALFGRPACMTV